MLKDHVVSLDTEKKTLALLSGREVRYDKLIIASGSKSNKPDYKGMDLKGVQGLYGMPDLELMFDNTKGIKRGVIVGGGLIGIEMAEMLFIKKYSGYFFWCGRIFFGTMYCLMKKPAWLPHIYRNIM